MSFWDPSTWTARDWTGVATMGASELANPGGVYGDWNDILSGDVTGSGKNKAPAPPDFGGVDKALLGRIGNQQIPTGQEARDQAITAAYDQAKSRLDPYWADQGEGMDASIANQGITVGDEAYGKITGRYDRSRNDAYAQAMMNAIGQGTLAGSTIFNQGIQSSMLPYNQFAAVAAPTLERYGGQMQQYGANQAGKNSLLNGAATLGAAGIMA